MSMKLNIIIINYRNILTLHCKSQISSFHLIVESSRTIVGVLVRNF